uniref:Peptidase M12B domain-containing protein n=1 Tax=Amblyomma maculatum TaxID=34609 RepID=G3MQA8_AMBMU
MSLFALVHCAWLIVTSYVVTCDDKHVDEQAFTVYPQVYEERQDSSEKILVIRDGYQLNLKKATILASRLLLRNVAKDGAVERYVEGTHYERHLYEDRSKQASLLLKPRWPGSYLITGLVNFTHRIEPSERWERSLTTKAAHRIVKIENKLGECGSDVPLENSLREETKTPEVEERGAIAQEFGVEIYFISDYYHTKNFSTEEDRVTYITLFMHSVSLRMDQLNPPVPISLKGIQGTNDDNESYVRLWSNGDLIGNETLKKLNEAAAGRPYNTSDAVYMATGREMISLIPGGKSSYLAGTAGESLACSANRAAVGEDKPNKFTGVNTAAHEIGHLLGAPDDGAGSAKECSTSDGYLMSRYTKGRHALTFSSCSKTAVADFLKKPDSQCLQKRFSCQLVSFPNKAVKLPGYVIDGDAFCKQFFSGFQTAYFLELPDYLAQCKVSCLVVEKSTNHLRFETTLAMDGTRCSSSDPFKVCKNSICT